MAFAQSENELPINDSLYNTIEESNNLDIFGGTADSKELMRSFSLKRFCPPLSTAKISNGGLGWTIAVTQAMSMQHQDLNNQQQLFSYQFIYDALPKVGRNQCSFSDNWMVDTKKLLETTGTLTLQQYALATNDCNHKPDAKLLDKARRYCVRSFNRIFEVTPNDGSISIGGKLDRIKKSLNRNHPVVLCIVADEQFRSLKTGIWTPSRQSEATLQTVVVIGFDENRQMIEVMGNYSTWGNGGFAYIHYEDMKFAKFAFEMVINAQSTPSPVVVVREPSPAKPTKPQASNTTKPNNTNRIVIKPKPVIANEEITLSGELVVNEVVGYNNYRKVEITRNQAGYYEMPRIYKVNDQFQLISQKSQTGSFVYVFSLDPKGKAEIHYPNHMLDEFGMSIVNISPVVPNKNSQVVIPGPRFERDIEGKEKRIERALSKSIAGTDWLVVLHSDRRLDNELDDLVGKLNHHTQDFILTFKQIFGERLIDKSHVKYHGSNFEANTRKGYIIPMIIKLEAN